jgi:pyruvate-formate lyase-activating enzyme
MSSSLQAAPSSPPAATRPSPPVFYAPSGLCREDVLNGDFHRRMIRIAFGTRAGAQRWFRSNALDQYHRLKVGFVSAQPHVAARLRNYVAFARQRLRRSRVSYLPPTLTIETGARCLLRCPGCLTGQADSNAAASASAPLTPLRTFKAAIDQTYRRCFQVAFFTHGEPLLNANVFSAIEYARRRGLWTVMHTNLMPRVSKLGEQLVAAGLSNLVVSIDGATQEIYALYRQGGKLDLVLDRIAELAELKRRRKARYPWISAKFIVFAHNWHEIELFRRRVLDAGADEAVFVSGFANHITGTVGTDFEFDLDTLTWRRRRFPESCPFLWTDLRLSTSGGLFSCGGGQDDADVFDHRDVTSTPLLERYNGPRHVRMRELFLERARRDVSDLPRPCVTCELVRRLPS